MIERRGAGQLKMGIDRAGFRVGRTVNQFLDPGLNHGSHAHDTWFYRDHEYGTGESIVAQAVAAVAQRENFRMSRGII